MLRRPLARLLLLVAALLGGAVAFPLHAQDSLSAQVLRLLVRDNTWTGLNDFRVDTDGSGGIQITDGTPSATTNRLYSVGGDLFWDGSLVTTAAGVGTVTSVDLTAPGIFSVTGNPITSSGTIDLALATQVANRVWAGPSSGGDATPTFRALVDADVPDTITVDGTNTVTWASVDKTGSSLADLATRSAGDLNSGTLALARLVDDGTAGIPLVSGGGGGDPQYAPLNLGSSGVTGTLAAARFPALTGDVTTPAGSVVTTLANSGVTAGTYGSATEIPIITVDGKGRITSASESVFTTHNLLSASHPDTLAGSPLRGAVIIGNATPVWAALTPTIAGTVLRFDGSDTAFSTDGSALTALNASNVSSGTLPVARGGTGFSTLPTNGQLLIGNGTDYTLNTLTGTANQVTVTNGAGTITLALPQAVATSSAPQFARLGLGVGPDALASLYVSGVTRVGVVAHGAGGATETFDLSAGTVHTITLDTATCTFSVTNPVAGSTVHFLLEQDGSGSRLVTWFSAIEWRGGAAPTLTTTGGAVDHVWCFYDGTEYFCDYALNFS